MVKGLLFRKVRRSEAANTSSPSSTSSSGTSESGTAESPGKGEDDPVKVDPWWRGSSFDLLRGLEVSEVDTVPAEVFDELFAGTAPPRQVKR